MAGTDLYWGHGEDALRELAEALGIPVFLNGLARGCLPADHELFFSRARGDGAQGRRRRAGDRRADGLPARLRRQRSARRPRSSSIDARRARARATRARSPPSSTAALPATLRRRCASGAAGGPRRGAWVRAAARDARTRSARPSGEELDDDRAPLHPMRVYRELAEVLDRDAIVIGDGGDFVSYAGRVDRHLRARLLAGPGPVRLPGRRARLRAGGQARPPRPAGRACCSATAPSASRGWSSTRWPATASPSSA